MRSIAAVLAAVTAAATLMLLPLIVDVIGTIGGKTWEPVLGVFVLTWLLLLGLLIWQAFLVVRAK